MQQPIAVAMNVAVRWIRLKFQSVTRSDDFYDPIAIRSGARTKSTQPRAIRHVRRPGRSGQLRDGDATYADDRTIAR
ncbi:MAG: hypothetical protein M3Y22_09210 [Pseudomonadota bacterium]|nr:hypothetical protein [Pseudomonadota bacterium]